VKGGGTGVVLACEPGSAVRSRLLARECGPVSANPFGRKSFSQSRQISPPLVAPAPASVTLGRMSDVTQLLMAAEGGDPRAAAELLPLVYDELRKLAASRLAAEKPGQTLQATALVHEAYARLVGDRPSGEWDGRGHFFAAAAEAMRRILVERARHKATVKRGGGRERLPLEPDELSATSPDDPLEVLAVHEALGLLAAESPRKAEVVKLRYFLGCTVVEAADILGVAAKTAEEDWTYARAWLRRRWLRERGDTSPD
jgi:RNA polymerase sigma factor (TIGR02999 family)